MKFSSFLSGVSPHHPFGGIASCQVALTKTQQYTVWRWGETTLPTCNQATASDLRGTFVCDQNYGPAVSYESYLNMMKAIYISGDCCDRQTIEPNQPRGDFALRSVIAKYTFRLSSSIPGYRLFYGD
ncbi:hypothetical protein MJO28_004602 [Puccinia striiformis f. sp. tritici]|uniref:Uncharacterized protein n=1 Tax=Puccinia striiformis f. sp. tritici TaxID=168172 RepID=A0ACC0ESY6_9BASI|nr:hypothetical protein MJO28_004602 [Puccinia striiformis f. sp. tritici]KAI7963166.1 hypothetical protein MJO29_003593 [Puccinia striiformis f. sp. tritici]